MAHQPAFLPNIDKRSLRARQQDHLAREQRAERPTDSRVSIQVACASEISKWCPNDEERAMELLNDGADRADLEAALLQVNQCLASRTSVLSTECLSSLAVAYMQASQDSGVYGRGRVRNQGRGIDRARDRFRQQDGPRRPVDDSEDTWQQPPPDNDRNAPRDNKQDAEKYYFWNKHGFGRANDDTSQIRSGGGGHPHHHDDGGFAHPVVTWLVILPFFALGVFVAARRAITFYRQRQLAMTHHSGDTRDYEPLNPCHSERQRREEDD
jgi:hypothetical protein